MKLVIKKLTSKMQDTKYGPKKKISILNGLDGKYYSCFDHPNCASWHEGQEIDVPVEQNGEYLNIVFPKQSQSSGGAADPTIHAKLDKIISILQNPGYATEVTGIPPHTDADKPVERSPF